MGNLFQKLTDELSLGADTLRQWVLLSDDGAVLAQAVAECSAGVLEMSISERGEGDAALSLSMTVSEDGQVLEISGVSGDSVNPELDFVRAFWAQTATMKELKD